MLSQWDITHETVLTEKVEKIKLNKKEHALNLWNRYHDDYPHKSNMTGTDFTSMFSVDPVAFITLAARSLPHGRSGPNHPQPIYGHITGQMSGSNESAGWTLKTTGHAEGIPARLLRKTYWMSKGIQSPPPGSTYLTGHNQEELALQLSVQLGTDASVSFPSDFSGLFGEAKQQ